MPRKRKYPVRLSEEEQTYLLTLVTQGTAKARTLLRAQAFLPAHEGKTDKEIQEVLPVSRGTLLKKQWCISKLTAEFLWRMDGGGAGAVRGAL